MRNKKIKEILKPTEVQLKLFAQHIANCHSWYKHLPLITGGSFVVFLDINAGINYPNFHPKLPYGNSAEKYKEAFGCLNYCYKTNSKESWQFDNNSIVKNPFVADNIGFSNYMLDKCSFKLYPFISEEFVETYEYHKNGFEKIRNGEYHPYGKQLLKLEKLHFKKVQLWENLTEEEMETIISISDYSVYKSSISDKMNDYINAEEEELGLLEQLRFEENKKIKTALENLIKVWR